MALESMRRGFIGGSALSLFIIKDFGLEKQAVPTINAMKGYLAQEAAILATLPWFMAFLATPYTDYHEANVLYLQILEILAELQQPSGCSFYWEKGE